MDTDLFQGVLLGLLAVGLIVLIALLATLGGIRKALEERSHSADRSVAERPAQAETATAPEAEAAPAPEEPQAGTGYTGAGSYATPIAGGTSAGGGDQAASIRSVLHDHGVASTESPVQEPAAQEPAVDSAFAAHADDPQEEPFQRDGRWWFRRGNELLLYDEASGQWQPAPDEAASQSAPAPATAPAGTAAAAAETTAPTQSMPAVADQVSTFWKCPTCGAVNGSTAATCRMCFAARP